MSLSCQTYLDIFFCLFAVLVFRPSFIHMANSNGNNPKSVTDGPNKVPVALSLNGGWNLNSPPPSPAIPSITVSPAQDDAPSTDNPQDAAQCSHSRMVSFAPCAVIVEDAEPPSTSSSDTLPSPESQKTHGRRGSDHIKISSVLAQRADGGKHTLKARPLTPFVKFNSEEEPLTAQVGGEFDTRNMSSVVIGKSIEGGVTMGTHGEIESVTFTDEDDMLRKPLLLSPA